MVGAAWQAMRPGQWTKNLFVLGGVVFAHRFSDPTALAQALEATVIFCLLSSASYVFNDLRDIERDRLHPRKCMRPLVAGSLSRRGGGLLAVTLGVGGLGASLLLGPRFGAVALAYLGLNLAYSLGLKRVVLLDVMAVAIGFVLRAVAGVVALRPPPEISPWLLVCTFFLALFLVVGKRRHERLTLTDEAALHRTTLAGYSPALLDQLVPIVTSATILTYALYTISPETRQHRTVDGMVATIPFVVYGVFRYLYLVYHLGRGGAPSELLLRDGPLLINVALWGALVLGTLYLF